MRRSYRKGQRAALEKFALGPPTQVDQFMADVEMGKDIPPPPPPMAQPSTPPCLDGHTPMPPLPSFGGTGSTVMGAQPQGPADPMNQGPPPPSMAALHG